MGTQSGIESTQLNSRVTLFGERAFIRRGKNKKKKGLRVTSADMEAYAMLGASRDQGRGRVRYNVPPIAIFTNSQEKGGGANGSSR